MGLFIFQWIGLIAILFSIVMLAATFLGVVAGYEIKTSPYNGDSLMSKWWIRTPLALAAIYLPWFETHSQELAINTLLIVIAVEAFVFVGYRKTLFKQQ